MKTALMSPNKICGTCKFYDDLTLLCEKHPEWGELVGFDTCDDWSEDEV